MSEKNPALYSYDDFRDADLSTPYLIDPILPRGGIGLIYGKGGHGKTQLVFRMIKDLTEGRPFLGLWEVERSRVLFIQADMPAGLFQERVRLADPDLRSTDRISIWHTDPKNVLDPTHRKQIRQAADEAEADLVIYDTLHKLHYEDENESTTPRLIYDAWKEAIDGRTSKLIHHARKGFFYRGDFMDSNEDLRGHTSWRDDADLAIRVRKDREDSRSCEMAFTRLRCHPQKSVQLRFNEDTLIMEPDPKHLQAEVVAVRYLNNGGSEEDLVEYLREFGFSRSHSFRIKEAVT